MAPGMILVDPPLTVIKGLVLENISIETAKAELSLSRHDKYEEERSALKDKLEMEHITSCAIHNVKVNGEEILRIQTHDVLIMISRKFYITTSAKVMY